MNIRIREIGENIKKSADYKGSVSFDEPMSLHTTMKVGGPACVFIQPSDTQSLIYALKECGKASVPVFVLGGGSNLVVSDDGIDKAVISTSGLNKVELEYKGSGEVLVSCGSGCMMDDIIERCAEYGVSGLECFAGLPGTAGGASYMNARCYEKNVSELISSVEYLNLEEFEHTDKNFVESLVKTYHNNNSTSDWGYKHSPFMGERTIITKVWFRLKALDEDAFLNKRKALPEFQKIVESKSSGYVQDRENKGHFKAPSAGSVFKNNHDFGKPSGKLIDEAGLKGLKSGGAQIAPWHGNFIINTGNATASDIQNLVKLVQDKVKEKTGFYLEPEIIFVK